MLDIFLIANEATRPPISMLVSGPIFNPKIIFNLAIITVNDKSFAGFADFQ